MPITLPPETIIEPADNTLLCKMYSQTGIWREGSKIVVPETAKEKIFFAHVTKAGPGKVIDLDENDEPIRIPTTIKPGDDVLFFRYHGEEIMIGDEFFILLKQEDVISKVTIPNDKKEKYVRFAKIGEYDDEALVHAKAS